MSNITANDALGLFEAYHSIYEPKEVIEESQLPPRRSAEERKKRSKEIGDRQTINDVVGKYNKGRQSSRQEDPKKYYTKEDVFDIVLEFLQVEGYAETLEEAEWIMANLIDEEAIEIILGEEYMDEEITSERGKAKAAEMIAKRTNASGRAKSGQGANVATIKHIQRSNRDGLGGTPPSRKTVGSNWPKSYSGLGGTGNKAARRSAALKKEDFESWLDEALYNYEQNRKEN